MAVVSAHPIPPHPTMRITQISAHPIPPHPTMRITQIRKKDISAAFKEVTGLLRDTGRLPAGMGGGGGGGAGGGSGAPQHPADYVKRFATRALGELRLARDNCGFGLFLCDLAVNDAQLALGIASWPNAALMLRVGWQDKAQHDSALNANALLTNSAFTGCSCKG
jgi:hypothetical protein